MQKSKTIEANDLILDAMKKNPKAGKILFAEGLVCCGCPMAMQETVAQGCMAHGMDVKKILKKINGASKKTKTLKKKKSPKVKK